MPDKSNQQLKFFAHYDSGKKNFDSYKKFAAICKFAKGVGLVGKVWASKKPLWLDDLSTEKNFLRLDAARKAGFDSAAAFAVHIKDDVDMVFAFFFLIMENDKERITKEISSLNENLGKYFNQNFSF
jgi:hypothetical protein